MYAKPLSNFICLFYWPFHDLSYKCDQWSIKIQLLWIRNISINWQFMKNSIWLFKGYGSNVKFWEPLAERKRYINFKDQIQQLNVTRVAWNLICLKIIHVVLWMWNFPLEFILFVTVNYPKEVSKLTFFLLFMHISL